MQPGARAEWDPLRHILVHEPGIEVFFALLDPGAHLYERFFNHHEARWEHRQLCDILHNSFGVRVHHLKMALLEEAREPGPVRDRLVALAGEHGRRIHIPSGAILGLDNLKVGQISPLRRPLLRTTKSPESLNIRAEKRMMLFSGKANDCIREFPKNINVAVALGLAAGREADVEIWIDPGVDRNIHEIEAEGDFGEIFIRVSNVPSPDNPATSYLAALSILTLLRNLEGPLVVGT